MASSSVLLWAVAYNIIIQFIMWYSAYVSEYLYDKPWWWHCISYCITFTPNLSIVGFTIGGQIWYQMANAIEHHITIPNDFRTLSIRLTFLDKILNFQSFYWFFK